jgi:hypothetical protein
MTNPEGIKRTSSTATEPVINIIPPHDGGEISWEVNDGEEPEIPGVQEKKEEEPVLEEKSESDKESVEEESVEDEEETDEEKPKKKLRSSKDRRFADFTRKIKQRDALLQEVYAQKANLERQLVLKEQEKITAEENSLKTHMESIERAHAVALEEGNNEKAAEASRLMAQYAARHETLTKQKHELVNYSQENQRSIEKNYFPLETQSEDFRNNGKEWIKNNSWADSNSDNYDEEMLEVAENHVNSLIKQYKFEGRANEIGQPDFFNQITDHVKEEFGISKPSTPALQKERLFSSPKGASGVAPVNRTGTTPNIKRSSQEISLTSEQIKIAHSMSGLKFNGQRITDKKTLENMYRENLKKQMGRG